MNASATAADQVVLQVSHEEAGAIVEGLHMLLNCRRFSFKEPQEDVRQLHASLFDTVERIEALVVAATGRKSAGSSE